MWAPAPDTHLPSLPGGRSVQALSLRTCLQTPQLPKPRYEMHVDLLGLH